MVGDDISGLQHHQHFGSNRSRVSLLVGSRQLTSPLWWGEVPAKQLKVIVFPLRGTNICPKSVLLFLGCSSLVSASPPLPD